MLNFVKFTKTNQRLQDALQNSSNFPPFIISRRVKTVCTFMGFRIQLKPQKISSATELLETILKSQLCVHNVPSHLCD
jgi:hypothetical protein